MLQLTVSVYMYIDIKTVVKGVFFFGELHTCHGKKKVLL